MPARPSRATPAPALPAPPRRELVWLCGLVIVAAGFLAYWGVRHAPLVFDDLPGIVENESIRDLTKLGRVLRPPSTGSGIDSRPVINLSLALNYAAGGLNPTCYHLTNIGIHVLGALALFGLVRRTLSLPGGPDALRSVSLPVALGAALLWAVHPLQSETVICVIQRTESLVSLFYLLMLYCFVRAAAPGGRTHWFWLALAACVVGMAAKEVMVTAPLVALLFDRTFVAGSFREAWRQRWRWYLAFAATWLVLAALVLDSGGSRGGTAGYGHGLSAWTYLLTQARAIVTYLKLTVWPTGFNVDYGSWRAHSFAEVGLEFCVLTALGMLTLVALWRWPRLGFLGACFFLILGPSSSIYPLLSQTIAEHRMHLPLAPLMVLVALMLWRVGGARTTLVACLVLATGAACLTARRGETYASEEKLWADVIEKSPDNPWGYFHLAGYHFRHGDFARSAELNEQGVQRLPGNAEMLMAWGLSLEKAGRPAEAAQVYAESLRLKPAQPKALFRLGLVQFTNGQPQLALQSFRESLRLQPGDFDTIGNFAVALLKLGHFAEAAPQFAQLVQLRPDSVDARYNLGYTLSQLGRDAEALPHFEAAARLAPAAADIQTALGRTLLKLGRVAEAREHLATAVRQDPNAVEARQLLERL